MAFDIDMIKKVYEAFGAKIDKARAVVHRPLTLSEKFFSHTYMQIRRLKISLVEAPM